MNTALSNEYSTGVVYSYLSEEDEKLVEFNETKKRLQVLKYVINRLTNPDIYSILKILYFADKDHLYKYDRFIVYDRYIKRKSGPVPTYYSDIMKLVSGEQLSTSYVNGSKYEELVRGEIEYIGDNKVRSITSVDDRYLSEINKKCLNESIEKYKDKSNDELRELSHDNIYNSVPKIDDVITVFDIARGLDETGEFEKHIRGIYKEY